MHEVREQWPADVLDKGLSFPCSSGQRRLWILHELDPHNPALNLTQRWRVEGKLSHAHLEKAFQNLLARHAVLRTNFARLDNEPVQFIAAQVAFLIPAIDLTAMSESDALAEAERIAQLEAGAPFDISVPPLIRVTHLRFRDQVSMLLVTVHRLICDEASLTILARELGQVCAAFQAGQAPLLPPLAQHFGDFVVWQAEQSAGNSAETQIEYWSRVLKGVKHFEIQSDHPRRSLQTANVGTQSILLDPELTAGLVRISQQCGCSLSEVALTGLFALLYRYSGEGDIAIGGQFSGRDDHDLDLGNLVGPFTNTLLLRHDLSDDPSFSALLMRLHTIVQQAFEHRHLPMEKLVEIANPSRDWNRNPLFSVNFHFQESSLSQEQFGNFSIAEVPCCSSGALYDLNFILRPYLLGWRVSCEYNSDLFDDQTVIGLLKHFTQLLRSALAHPENNISALTMLEAAEERELIVNGNRTAAPYPRHMTVPQLFMTQAEHTPNAIAVVCGAHSMTYQELDVASSRLAQLLQERGLAPATRIGVFLNRSTELLVSVLAILKSGSAYIPLDPLYPAERLAHVFENSRPAAVITRTSLRSRLALGKTPAVVVDAEPELSTTKTAPTLSHTPLPSDTAYLIYTSGSTGRPKGVQIGHRALVNLLWAMRSQPGITSADTVISVTTISFDMVVPDLFLPLIVGAKLVIATEDVVADGGALLQLMREHGATWMQATPVTWQLLLAAGWQGDPVLKVMCGGEALTRSLAESLLACGAEVWNLYGPTETTVWSAVQRVESAEGPVPIGPPIANTQFYILDRHRNLVPPGVPGELYIGGDGVALGYFDLPDLTQEKFIPDRFRNLPEARMYRTGDIMRRRESGQFEYLGRCDHQVKLRGFRIELGEIESVLLRHSEINEAVAVLGQDPSGQAALWAYAVARHFDPGQTESLIDSLRALLAQSLPGYMRPSSIVVLESLPRTPNGKIDRRALPTPPPGKAYEKAPTLPSNDIEQRLAKIWTTLLGIEAIDTSADFFEMGGNSLLAARLMIGIETEFGKRLSLAALFKAPTIAQQAQLLDRNDAREYDFRQVVRLQPNGSKTPLIAIHNTGVYFYHLSKRLGSEQPLTALQLFDPSIPRPTLPQSLEEIAAEYVQLIRQFQPSGPYALLGWCVGGVLAFEVARQLVQQEHQVQLLALIDSWAPGHLSRMPRLRARLADFSHRLKLIAADWRRVTSYRQSVREFLAHRVLFKRLLRALGHQSADKDLPVAFEDRNRNAENYDQWLLGYLDNMASRYTPKPYAGKITLLCSAGEPRGLFIDPKMGWEPFTSEVDVQIIEGDHFTMFQGEGLKQMAQHIAAAQGHGERRKSKSYQFAT